MLNSDRFYFDQLVIRASSCVEVRCAEVSLSDGWVPVANHCHENADRWAADCPNERKVIRGWLVWPPSEFRHRHKFIAHSVVQQNGEFVDITPFDTPRKCTLFLEHFGSADEFEDIKSRWSEIDYPPISFEEWREAMTYAGDVDESDSLE